MHVGALITWQNADHEHVAAYVRRLGRDTRIAPPEFTIDDPEGAYTIVPFALVLDYFRTPDGVTFIRHSHGGFGKHMRIDKFAELWQRVEVRVVDVSERYLDRDVKVVSSLHEK